MAGSDENTRCVNVVRDLCRLPSEVEWVEFKRDKWAPEEIGEYISALANAAALAGQTTAYLVWGVADRTHQIVGTRFRPSQEKRGNEPLENWLARKLAPRVDFRIRGFDIDGKPMVLFEIPGADHQPVRFGDSEYIRIGFMQDTAPGAPRERTRSLAMLRYDPLRGTHRSGARRYV